MKKLNKLQINPEKIINNKELVTLRGGYGAEFCCWVGLPGGGVIDPNFCFSSNGGLIQATSECGQFYQEYFPGAFCVCD